MIFFRLPLQKSPLLNMGIQERGFPNGEDFKNLNFTCSLLLLLHAARYSERCGYCRYD